VIADLCGQTPEPSKIPDENATWIELDRAAYAAAMEGRVADRLTLASRAFAIAKTPDQRAYSSLREAGAWDQLGRYSNAMEAARRGLRERDLSPVVYCDLKGALASAHLMLGDIEEGEALATTLNERLQSDRRFANVYSGARAFVRFLMALASGDRASHGGPDATQLARIAREHYASAKVLAERHASESGSSLHRSIAMGCECGILEMDVLLGEVTPESAIGDLLAGLDADTESQAVPDACLEAIGWSCIVGSQLVLRFVEDPSLADRQLAIFTNKADDIARRTGNWALRERIWMLEYRKAEKGAPLDFSATVLDPEDLRDLTGTMGRFPAFREVGWSLLRGARRIGEV